MGAMGSQDREEALEMFLSSCRAVSQAQQNPDILRMAQEAIAEMSHDRSAVVESTE